MKRHLILLDNGHGSNTAGKRSPDGTLLEYQYTRDMTKSVFNTLKALGYNVELLVPELYDVSLSERVRRVNQYCNDYGASNVVVVSIHINAAGNGTQWMTAKGWSVYTSKGKTKSDELATIMCEEAEKSHIDFKIRKDMSDGDADWEENFTILSKTKCPAVLSENFFMDNKEDVNFLLSQTGKDVVKNIHINSIIRYANKYFV
jgi:N-acetylmuramoyl-L-alanine amidase